MIWVATPSDMYDYLARDLREKSSYLILSNHIVISEHDPDAKNITTLFLNRNALKGVPFGRDYGDMQTKELYRNYILSSSKILELFINIATFSALENVFILCREHELDADWMYLWRYMFEELTGTRIVRYPGYCPQSNPNFPMLDELRVDLFLCRYKEICTSEELKDILNRQNTITMAKLYRVFDLDCNPYKDKKIAKAIVKIWREENEPDYADRKNRGFRNENKKKKRKNSKKHKRSWWEI